MDTGAHKQHSTVAFSALGHGIFDYFRWFRQITHQGVTGGGSPLSLHDQVVPHTTQNKQNGDFLYQNRPQPTFHFLLSCCFLYTVQFREPLLEEVLTAFATRTTSRVAGDPTVAAPIINPSRAKFAGYRSEDRVWLPKYTLHYPGGAKKLINRKSGHFTSKLYPNNFSTPKKNFWRRKQFGQNSDFF